MGQMWASFGGRRSARWLTLALLGVSLLIAPACQDEASEPPAATASAMPSPRPPGETILTGWFNVIFGPTPRFFLDSEAGQSYELLIDESYLQSLGGALAFNRQRVTVTGALVPGDPPQLRVTALHLA